MNHSSYNKNITKISAIVAVGYLLAFFTYQQADASHQQQAVSTSKVAKIIHDKVNEARAQKGLAPLAYNYELQKVAQARSDDMASKNYFSHVNKEGQRPSDVAKEMGYNCRNDLGGGRYTIGIGENIYKKTGQLGSEEKIAEAAFAGWMKSPGHRANILNGNYDSEAIAFTITGKTVYVTQNFC